MLRSFHNYSYQQQQGAVAIKTNQQEAGNFSKTRMQMAKNQADMAHIGELESDNDMDDEYDKYSPPSH